MKFDAHKAYPHPVLRPENDDYLRSSFKTEIDFERMRNSTEAHVMATFTLRDDDLLHLIEQKTARYMLIARCIKTYFRLALDTFDTTLEHTFAAGQLSGPTEFSAFLICSNTVQAFRAGDWHKDYESFAPLTFDPGTVLAVSEPKEYWVDTAEETPIGSIFELQAMNLDDGQWDCDLDGERIKICMSINDYAQFHAARECAASDSNTEQAYIMNSIYLLALHHVLVTADDEVQQYEERRWFRSLNHRLKEIQAKPLGVENQNRLKDAQRALDNPFAKLPFMLPGEFP